MPATTVIPINRIVRVETHITILECATCNIVFGIGADFEGRRREDHEHFYCPNGHQNFYNGPTEAEKERDRYKRMYDSAEWRAKSWRDQARSRRTIPPRTESREHPIEEADSRGCLPLLPPHLLQRRTAHVQPASRFHSGGGQLMMSVTEASAAQYVLDFAARQIRQLRHAGAELDVVVVIDEYGRTITMDQILAQGRKLAEQSYKKLHAGMDGNKWDQLTEPGSGR